MLILFFLSFSVTEQDSVAVTFEACIRDELGSILGRATYYADIFVVIFGPSGQVPR